MSNPIAVPVTIAVIALTCVAAATDASARRSQSGPRGPSGAVEYAPVDALGPTLPPDNLMTPNSGWNRTGSPTLFGPLLGPLNLQPAVPGPAAPTAPPANQPYIIVQ
jgi:hypothetical protein